MSNHDYVNLPNGNNKSHQNGVSVEKPKGKRILIFRHGERIDFTFNEGGDWVNRAFDNNGRLV